jgi:hypothetical protein
VKEGLAMPLGETLLGATRAAAAAVVHVVGVVAAAGVVVAAADVGVVAAAAEFGVTAAAAAAAAEHDDDDIVVAAAGISEPAASVRAHAHQAPCQAACSSWALPGWLICSGDVVAIVDSDVGFAVVVGLEVKLS